MYKYLSVVLLFVASCTFAQLQRVEPAFWWKGMKNPEVQILLYGKNIAQYDVQTSNHVPIKQVTKVENPNYLFVTVDLSGVSASSFQLTLTNLKGKKIDSYTYELKDRKANSSNRNSFSSKDVMYLIMPDRFANGDTTNDSMPGLTEKANRNLPDGRHGGDLRGIINALDYLKNLGATALWLTPANEDNEGKTTYHGYAQTDLYRLDPRYGTNEECLELSRELKKRDMKLVMDYVTNHWGSKHWLIQDLPTKDWIHYFDGEPNGFKRSNYKTTTQTDTNASEIDRKLALNGWFDTTMPDLNQQNPLVLNYLTQNAIWWIEYADLDGFRVDTYPYNDKHAMAKWAKAITDEYPKFNIVGEAWLYSPAHIAYWQKDSKIGELDGYNSHLPSVMDFTLFSEMPSAFKNKESWDKGMIQLYNAFTSDFLYPDINNFLVFFENHDTERWNEIFNGDVKAYQMALTLIATVRGIPQIYYGSEIGMRGSKPTGGDADIRRDFPGGWKGDPQNAFDPKTQTSEQKQFFDFTQKLLNWRKTKEVIHTGKTTNYLPENNVFVYFRYNTNDKVMVIINNSEEEQSLDLSRFSESLQGKTKGKDVISGNDFSLKTNEKIMISAKSSLILELQ